MSNNLNLDQLVDGQNQPEVTINDALGQLDAAMTEVLSVDLSAGNQTISSDNFRRNFLFSGTGHSVTRSITIPNIKRFFSVFNNGTGLINVVKGSTSLPLSQGAHALYYSAGGADTIREIADVGKDLNDNWTATTDPGAGDDIADGYSPGTRWRNTVTGELFLCVDNTSSAAVWVHISLTADELGSMAFEDTTDYYTASEFEDFLDALLENVYTTYSTGVGNVGTGEDDLLTHEFPENTLLDNEDSVWFEGSVVLGASANDKRLRVHFGTSGNTLIFDTGVLSITGETHITIIGRVIRTGIDSQKAYCAFISNDPTVQGLSGFTAALDQDLSDPVILRITGEATDDDDIIAETLSVGTDVRRVSAGGRTVLDADIDYFVRTDGDDSNSGLVNTSGGAFLTVGKAIEVISKTLDLNGYMANINVADGTYTDQIVLRNLVGEGCVNIIGNVSTPANVVFSTTSQDVMVNAGDAKDTSTIGISNTLRGTYKIKGFTITTTTGGNGISLSGGILLFIEGAIVFGACVGNHMIAQNGAIVHVYGSYSITGGAACHIFCLNMGIVRSMNSGITITLTGTPAFSTAFANCTDLALIRYLGFQVAFSGSATGKRYDVTTQGMINTTGAGTTYFPGNVNGTTASGGTYA